MSVSLHNRLLLGLCFLPFATTLHAESITMPTADIEGVRRCMIESEFKVTDRVVRGISMNTGTIVVSPSCTPNKWFLFGIEIEGGRFWSNGGDYQDFVGNPRARAKLNLFSWRRPGGWQKLTAELGVPLDIGQPFQFFADSGIGRWYNYQLQQKTPGFAPQAGMYFGVDRASWVLTLGARYVPAWSRHEITTPQVTESSVLFERLLHRFTGGAEVNVMLGATGTNIGRAKIEGRTLESTGGTEVMSQIGTEWVISTGHIVEVTYETGLVEHLRPDQFPQSDTIRVAYRYRR